MNESRITRVEKVVGGIIVVILFLILLINSIVAYESKPYIYTEVEKAPSRPVALILGAAVYKNGALTPVLYDRAVTALLLYQKGIVSRILISGDNSTIDHNEVIPVSKFLISQGVPRDAIFLDYAGFDTYDSMYRAQAIFKIDALIVVTQAFHLPRAVYIARHLGIDAIGVSADMREYYLRNSIREFFATVKAFFDVYTHAAPKYLGEPIPVGSSTSNVPLSY